MRAITQRGFAAVLASAKEHTLRGISGVFDRCKARVFVAAIAKGLLAAFATSAPEVGFTLFNVDGIGRFLGDYWRGHGGPPWLCMAQR